MSSCSQAATLVVTADTEEDFERSREAARKQLAFYGSTPAYRPTLDCHGWGDLHRELNRLSKQGRWEDLAGLVEDPVLEAIAVVGPRAEIAGEIDMFNNAVRDRADKAGTGFIDIIAIPRRAADEPELVASDGLHPSGRMYSEWVELIYPEVIRVVDATD